MQKAPTGRLLQMDGLRGIAMLFVFIGHFAAMWSRFAPADGLVVLYLRIVDADATLGSSFFMLLSSFFAYGSLRRGNRAFGEFIRGRARRIYPLYLVMNGVYILGSLAIPEMSKLPHDNVDALVFLVQTLLFLPGLLPVRPLMDVSWTLSFVVLFYFVAGGFARLFHRWPVGRPTRVALFCGAGLAWAVFGDWTFWWEPRTTMFWFGMALAEVVEAMTGDWREVAVRLVLPAAPIVVVGVWLRTYLMFVRPETPVFTLFVWRALITATTLCAFVWVCYFGPQWWTRLLAARQLRELGVTSYSFYLTHGFAVKAFQYGVIPLMGAAAITPLVFWSSQIVGLVLAVWIARMAYRWVENPLAKLVPPKPVESNALRQAG